jgi:anaerobic selenocysteine-containing dehydrogenase
MVTRQEKNRKQTVTGICGICPGGCGINIELVDGKIESIFPFKNHPMGVVCVRGLHAKEIVYSEDRLKYPLLRTGEKGEGKFDRIGWDEALDRIADAFQKVKREYGAEAVMSYFGRGSFDNNLTDLFGARGMPCQGVSGFLFPFGSPNGTGCSSVCYVSYGIFAPLSTIGARMEMTFADFDSTDLVVLWGANPPTDSPPKKMKKILEAKKRGVRVIAIDHMRSGIARMADQWVGVRSGTDGALALSMMYVIINERLYDEAFVQNWTKGFEELRDYVQQFPPEKVQAITRVPKETIVALAREIAKAKGISLVMYTGLEYTSSGVQNIRAVLSLWAITGNLDVPGGLAFRPRSPVRFPRVSLEPPKGVKPIGADRHPLFCDVLKAAHFMEAPRAILKSDPYPIKALLVLGASMLTSLPNPDLLKECFRKLDFMAVFDRFMTGDAMYADIILPATTNFENLGYQRYPGGHCQLRQKIIEPIGEARSQRARSRWRSSRPIRRASDTMEAAWSTESLKRGFCVPTGNPALTRPRARWNWYRPCCRHTGMTACRFTSNPQRVL